MNINAKKSNIAEGGIRLPYAVHNRAIARSFYALNCIDARHFGIFEYSW